MTSTAAEMEVDSHIIDDGNRLLDRERFGVMPMDTIASCALVRSDTTMSSKVCNTIVGEASP